LATAGYPVPTRKRLALVLTGLVAGEPATVSGLSRTLASLAVTPAQEPSIARRLLRTLADPGLDPIRVLPALFGHYLPELLAGLIAAHGANAATASGHHRRFRPVRLVVDETSQEDAVHLLVVGLLYQGVVLPLAVRAWPQNAPLPADAYWAALGGLLWEVHGLLPACLRDHVVLLADRGYGHPRMVDLANSLGWAWVLRTTGSVALQFPDGTTRLLRELVPQPGRRWSGGKEARAGSEARASSEGATVRTTGDLAEPLAVFKTAGWRRAQVVAIWLEGQAEPWLLVTSLPAAAARLAEYAQRWAIERLFLTWKSHGWNLESGRVRDAVRLSRLVSMLIVATWWRIASALPAAGAALERLAGHSPRAPRQLALPLAPERDHRPDHRPWPAKRSLFTWGRMVVQDTQCRQATPALDWSFPDWDAPPWPQRCQQVATVS
jgi:hypothetical protein